MKPMIDQSFWSDPDIETAKAGTKLAALWMITNSQTSLLGICNATAQRFSFETGLPANALTNAIEALPRAFKRFGSVVFIRNYIRHQFGIGEKLTKNNFFISLKSLFLAVKDEELKEFIAAEYPEFLMALSDGRVHRDLRDHSVATGLREMILHRDEFMCVLTGEVMPEDQLEIDHVHPLSKGGRTIAENLVAMSKVLNTKKNKKDLKTFCEEEGFDFESVMQRTQTRALKPLLGLPKPKESKGKGSRAGEGMQGEGSENSKPAQKPKPATATKEEVKAFFLELQLSDADAEWFFEKNVGSGWTNNGKPIRDWKATVRSWRAAKYLPSQKANQNNGNGSKPIQPPTNNLHGKPTRMV